MTPQITTSPVASRTASTSTSTASSRNRSTSTGRSAVTPPSRPNAPPDGRTWPRRPPPAGRRRRRSPWPGRRARRRAAPAPGSRSAEATRHRLGGSGGGAARRLGDAEAGCTARSTARGPRPGRSRRARCPSTRSSGMLAASLSGVWPPRETMTPTSRPPSTEARLLGLEHVGHVLGGQRLEVQPVRGVVVRGDRLGVAVDHHRLVAGGPQGERGVHAAVVELDALADPVGARPQDDHPGPGRAAHLVLVLGGRVVVRGVGLELGAAGVDRLEGGHHAAGSAGPPGSARPR